MILRKLRSFFFEKLFDLCRGGVSRNPKIR
jgi:hypothetical protein